MILPWFAWSGSDVERMKSKTHQAIPGVREGQDAPGVPWLTLTCKFGAETERNRRGWEQPSMVALGRLTPGARPARRKAPGRQLLARIQPAA